MARRSCSGPRDDGDHRRRPGRSDAVGGCWCRGRRTGRPNWSTLLRRAGAEAGAVPLIAIAAPADPGALDLQPGRPAPGGYDWVGFTSVNAVAAVLDRAAALGLHPPSRPTPGSPRSVRPPRPRCAHAGLPVDLVPPRAGSAAALGASLADGRGRRAVLLPRSDIAAPTLPDALVGQGLSRRDGDGLPDRTVPSAGRVAAELAAGRIRRGAVHLAQHGDRAGRHADRRRHRAGRDRPSRPPPQLRRPAVGSISPPSVRPPRRWWTG